jgi:putative membrane protein
MKLIIWTLRLLLVILLTGFAIKNADPVTLRYYFDYEWHAPLVLILLVFFVIGAVLGLLVPLGTIFRLRRELNGIKRAQKRDATESPGAAEAKEVRQ